MKLSIVTINYNDAVGLQKTLQSVANQIVDCRLKIEDFQLEHVIVDGGSIDGSVDIIKDYVSRLEDAAQQLQVRGERREVRWISEKDKGVYNAMNKGIKMATGDYIQILNSGDILAADNVIARMYESLMSNKLSLGLLLSSYPEILYGNMIKDIPRRKPHRDSGLASNRQWTMLDFYHGTMNHDCAWIKRDLFDKFGLYDEDMKICSDWKWYVNAIALGLGVNGERLEAVKPVYVDIDVTIFDMNGISESGGKNKAIIQKERRDYLEKVLPAAILADYDNYGFEMQQIERLKKHHLYGVVYFMERVLFKLEKWGILK